ncbi:MAG: protein kinase [Deltaproteobacteria bacterium]|nr:protein kinase [Deltaproteobacteria bacterium]
MSLCAACGSDAGDIAKFCPSCGATVVRGNAGSGDPFIGRTIAGKFRIESLLGEGGMGMVYKATQVNLGKTIVLKVLRPSLVSDERTVQRFQREARAASRLNHANSIGIIDFGQSPDDGSMYIAMEYCNGHDLHHILSREWPLDEGRIIRIMSQVLSALAEAHAHGVIHRDLKPENIMIEQRRGEPDFVKVLDFGIAKITDTTGEEGQALTRAGFVCGTPEYMSPEQARGAQIDHRSDLYAVGVIIYQLVTGLLPFDSESAVGFATAHLTQDVPPIRKRRPEARCSPQLERLVMRALSKDPAQRPQNADDFRDSLLSLAPGAPAETETSAPSADRTRVIGKEEWTDQTPADSSTRVNAAPEPNSRGRMPSARGADSTAFEPQTATVSTREPPPTSPDAAGFSGASRIAVAVTALGLLGASAFFVYEYFIKRPVPAQVLEPISTVTPVDPPPEDDKPVDNPSAMHPVEPPKGTTGAPHGTTGTAVAMHGTTGSATPAPSTTGGHEIDLTNMSKGNPGLARQLLEKSKHEPGPVALATLQSALDADPGNIAVLRTYFLTAMRVADKDPTKRGLAAELGKKLEDAKDASAADRSIAHGVVSRYGGD